MSTILFLLSTVHVGVSLQQLLDAFVYAPANVPDYSTTYWLDYTTTPRVLKNNLFITLVFTQHVVRIWRLYVVFMCDWKVVIFPVILTTGCTASAYAASAVLSTLPNEGLYGSVTTSLMISAWVFSSILDASVTGATVTRLWQMDRTMASLIATPINRFASSIYIIVESGTISVVCSSVVLALFVTDSPGALTGLDVVSQLAALWTLSIIVLVGRTNRYHIPSDNSSKTIPITQDDLTFRGVPREQDSRQDLSLCTTLSRLPSIPHGVQIW
ncbi:hypothetical protein HD554DRAFT_2143345 [Boletus coccyginus]|nr:hypothetical protein HD554DRAFT_2143345 [Boletus coccyginus]